MRIFGILCVMMVCAACGSEVTESGNNSTTNNRSNSTTTQQNNHGTNNTTTHNNTTIGPSNNTTHGTTNNASSSGEYKRIVSRGKEYFGSAEKFNRYYTDSSWTPSRVIYVDLTTSETDFSKQSYDSPISVGAALQHLQPGDLVFVKKTGDPMKGVNIQLNSGHQGTHENPVVFFGERNADGTLGVEMQCKTQGSNAASSCFNLEAVNYIAVDGFRMEGGNYGVRSVGKGYTQADHQIGTVIVNNRALDQQKDPFFSGQSDWFVIESNIASGGGARDGHGIYLSNGSDWNIARYNELFENTSSDFQINADPISTCQEAGIGYSDTACHGDAKNGLGQGVSEYMTISYNYFHDGIGQGPNFTSVRNSYVGHNIIGPYRRHGTSFWQETQEARLGSANNEIIANMFIGHRSHLLQFVRNSSKNKVHENIFLALTNDGSQVDKAVGVMETDDTVDNTYRKNIYFSGTKIGHSKDSTEEIIDALPSGLFPYAYARKGHPEDWKSDASIHPLGGWIPPVMATFPSPFTR